MPGPRQAGPQRPGTRPLPLGTTGRTDEGSRTAAALRQAPPRKRTLILKPAPNHRLLLLSPAPQRGFASPRTPTVTHAAGARTAPGTRAPERPPRDTGLSVLTLPALTGRHVLGVRAGSSSVYHLDTWRSGHVSSSHASAASGERAPPPGAEAATHKGQVAGGWVPWKTPGGRGQWDCPPGSRSLPYTGPQAGDPEVPEPATVPRCVWQRTLQR